MSNTITDYTFYCHHMTINMGKVINPHHKHLVGTEVKIILDTFGGINEDIYAFFGAVDARLIIPNPHITAAIRTGSGYKPKDSNSIRNDWEIEPIVVRGIVTENTEEKGYCSILLNQNSHNLLKSFAINLINADLIKTKK
jgi:hypothetical protein